MNYDLIKAAIAAVIKENGNEEITGNILQQSLLAIIDVLGLGYQYAGIATPATNPGTPDAKVFYIAQAKGTYSNFNDGETTPVLDGTQIWIFAFDTVWTNTALDVATKSSVEEIVQGITEALADKIDKVADVTPGNLPKFTTNGGLEDSDIPATDVATKQELAVATLPGLAEAVIDTDGAGTEQQFTFCKSGGDGGAYYRKIKGKTIAWNQLCSPVVISEATFTDGVRVNTDGVKVIVEIAAGGATALRDITNIANYNYSIPDTSGHKRIFYGAPENAISVGIRVVNGYTEIAPNSIISEGANAVYYGLRIPQGTPEGVYVFYPQVTDLTLAGMPDITASEFLALYPGYHEYNPGTLKSNDAEAVETTGVNQWDEEWEVGGIGSGEPFPDNSQMRSKNYTPVIAGTTLCFTTPNALFIYWYDANKNYINEYSQVGNSSIAVVPNSARYLKLTDRARSTYNHDICVNLSNPAINGQYFPYWKRTLQLGITTRKDTDGNVPFADGMKGAGTAADWADKVGGEKRMKRVDLGNVNWEYNATYQFFVGAILDNPSGVAGVTPNLICSKYETYATRYDSQVASGPDKIISGYSAAQGVIIYDTDHSAADLVNGHAAWLEGVMLDYELATPVPFTWAEPLNLGVKVDENGTERAVAPEGATEPSAPFVADTTYTMSIQRMVQKLATL